MTNQFELSKQRLYGRVAEVLDPATAAELIDDLARTPHVLAATALLDELREISPKVMRAVIAAMPDLRARAGLGEASTWLDLCVALAESSGATALKFVKESPWLLAMIEDHDRRLRMLRLALELAERDANVAVEFFRVSPELARLVVGDDLVRWTDIGLELTDRDYVLGLEFFRESPRIAQVVPLEDVRAWIEFGLRLISVNQFGKTDYFATLEYLRTSPRLLQDVQDESCRRWIVQLGTAIAGQDPQLAVEVLAEAPALFLRIEDPEWRRRMLQLALLVADRDAVSARDYVRRCPEVVGWLGYDERARAAFDEWFKNGMEILAYSPEGARAYFGLETTKAMSAIQEAQSSVSLRQVARSVKFFVQALCGRDVAVQELPESEQLNKRPARARVSQDGRTLYLPSLIRRHADRDLNVRAYTVMAAHEAGHLEFGTYDLDLGSLEDLTAAVAGRYGRVAEPPIESLAGLFRLYPQPSLMRDLWTILEDARVESRLRVHYPGLSEDLSAVARDAVETRSLSQGMSVREMVVDGLLVYSVGIYDVQMPEAVREPLARAWARCAPVLAPAATAADAVRAADRIYVLLDELVGRYEAPADAEPTPADEPVATPAVTEGPAASETLSAEYRSLDNLSFRGGMDPEHIGAQEGGAASESGRNGGETNEGLGARRSARGPARLLEQESDGTVSPIGAESAPQAGADEVRPVPDRRRSRWEPSAPVPRQFQYDEWDGMLRDYRAKWCRVVERDHEGQNPDFVEEVLRRYGPTVRLLRRYFESIRPPGLRVVRGMQDGEEIDFDAVVSFRADLAAGAEPSERLYLRREHRQRDVAVAFLIDISGSTSRRLEGEDRRVIDVEKAGLVLLCEALAAVGDRYAMYGFSGKGRRQVELAVLKDFDRIGRAEALARIGALEPQHQNRDGAAIRHATRKLAATGARNKLLVLISDGKPLDDGYADEYALEDTKMALREAGDRGVDPFCITVDPGAEAYVRRMYGDVQYLIIDRIEGLPERLPRVYHRLTR